MNHCSLCSDNQAAQPQLQQYHTDNKRSYYQCPSCHLVSVPDDYLLSDEEEKLQYELHQNTPDDPGYRRFLSRTLTPLLSRLDSTARGLDFGCGPGPALGEMVKASDIKIDNYDPYFFDDPQLLTKTYDFVVMTEVIEHVRNPGQMLQLLDSLIKPGGILAIMTKRVIDKDRFARWHYKNDPTHIRFYSEATFEWIARQYQWSMELIDNDVVFFYKNKN